MRIYSNILEYSIEFIFLLIDIQPNLNSKIPKITNVNGYTRIYTVQYTQLKFSKSIQFKQNNDKINYYEVKYVKFIFYLLIFNLIWIVKFQKLRVVKDIHSTIYQLKFFKFIQFKQDNDKINNYKVKYLNRISLTFFISLTGSIKLLNLWQAIGEPITIVNVAN